MQGPKTNPVLNNLPLSTHKRKGVSSKTLSCKTKRKIDTVVVDACDMARVLVSAFKVLTSAFFPFLFLYFLIDHFPLLSSLQASQHILVMLTLIKVQFWSQFKKLQLMIF
jgi:hypothetical protein